MATTGQMPVGQANPGLKPATSIVQEAMNGSRPAIESMFRSFLPTNESFAAVEYLGVKGFFGLGRKCFGAVTDTRVARIELGLFGDVLYQEAMIRDVNSIVISQPSILYLYIIVGFLVLMAIPTFGLALLLIFFAPQIYYRFVKSGVVLGVKEGFFLYAFSDRARLPRLRALITAMARQR